jgi:hypothetical protein
MLENIFLFLSSLKNLSLWENFVDNISARVKEMVWLLQIILRHFLDPGHDISGE